MQLLIWKPVQSAGYLLISLSEAAASLLSPAHAPRRVMGGMGASTLHPAAVCEGREGNQPGAGRWAGGCFLTDKKVVPVVCPEQLGSDQRSLGGPFRLSPWDTRGLPSAAPCQH